MLPILVSMGPVKIYSYGVCLAVGLFLSLYWWWKMGRDEHWEEIALFDGFFLSIITYLVAGRIGYVFLNMGAVGTVFRALAFLAYPGINSIIGIVVAAIFMIFFARAHNWDEWKVADVYVVSLSIILASGGLGTLLNGTSPIWQVNAWGLSWGIITFAVVSRVRKNFRFYGWYKGESSMAQDGLASLIFTLLIGIYFMVVAWIDRMNWLIVRIPGEFLVGLLIFLISGYLIGLRVGRRGGHVWSKLSNIIRRK